MWTLLLRISILAYWQILLRATQCLQIENWLVAQNSSESNSDSKIGMKAKAKKHLDIIYNIEALWESDATKEEKKNQPCDNVAKANDIQNIKKEYFSAIDIAQMFTVFNNYQTICHSKILVRQRALRKLRIYANNSSHAIIASLCEKWIQNNFN